MRVGGATDWKGSGADFAMCNFFQVGYPHVVVPSYHWKKGLLRRDQNCSSFVGLPLLPTEGMKANQGMPRSGCHHAVFFFL